MHTAIVIDALGKPCPMPLLLLKKQLKQNTAPQQYLLKSSDPNSQIDLARYCQLHHYSCQVTEVSQHEFHYFIQT